MRRRPANLVARDRCRRHAPNLLFELGRRLGCEQRLHQGPPVGKDQISGYRAHGTPRNRGFLAAMSGISVASPFCATRGGDQFGERHQSGGSRGGAAPAGVGSGRSAAGSSGGAGSRSPQLVRLAISAGWQRIRRACLRVSPSRRPRLCRARSDWWRCPSASAPACSPVAAARAWN